MSSINLPSTESVSANSSGDSSGDPVNKSSLNKSVHERGDEQTPIQETSRSDAQASAHHHQQHYLLNTTISTISTNETT